MYHCLDLSDGLVEMLCLGLTQASPMDLWLMLLGKAADRNPGNCAVGTWETRRPHRGEGHMPWCRAQLCLCMELLCRKTAEGLGTIPTLRVCELRSIRRLHGWGNDKRIQNRNPA